MEMKLNTFQSYLKSTDDEVQKIIDLVQSRRICVDDCSINNIAVKLKSLEEIMSTIKDESDVCKVVNPNLRKSMEKSNTSAESSPGKINYLESSIQRAKTMDAFM